MPSIVRETKVKKYKKRGETRIQPFCVAEISQIKLNREQSKSCRLALPKYQRYKNVVLNRGRPKLVLIIMIRTTDDVTADPNSSPSSIPFGS